LYHALLNKTKKLSRVQNFGIWPTLGRKNPFLRRMKNFVLKYEKLTDRFLYPEFFEINLSQKILFGKLVEFKVQQIEWEIFSLNLRPMGLGKKWIRKKSLNS
jgi:hypothetical protein